MSKHSASIAWAGLAVYVITYDIWAMKNGQETLSSACYRAYRHPVGKWLVISWAGVTGKHLFAPDFYPQADPYGLIALAIRGTNWIRKGNGTRILGT